MSKKIDELASLIIDFEEGVLDPAGIERVREILRADEEARAFFVQQQMLGAALQLEASAGIDPTSDAMTAPMVAAPGPSLDSDSARTNSTRFMYAMAAAAVVLICALTSRIVYLEHFQPSASTGSGETTVQRDGGPNQPQAQEATAHGVALVTRLVDVTWEPDQKPLEIGDAIPPGRLALASGFAQIEFFCGATVILEGPADLDLKSPMLARVRQGRLRAQVPPAARGFSLEVDDMKLVDLGTEFGLSISEAGANVQVFDGEVQLHRPAQDERLLAAGQALLRNPDGEFEDMQVTPERFLDIESLESRDAGQRDQRYRQWKLWSDELRSDPRLIAYYAFDQNGGWQRRLDNSLEPSNPELDGAIVGANRATGRWDAKSSLEFKRPGDRVRVNIPGEFGSLTFAVWVKIDSLDRWYNSLFLTDGYNQGEPHWQILDTGQLFFSVRWRPDEARGAHLHSPAHRTILSPPFWKPSLSGRWLHLATTYQVDTGLVTHYLNGQVLHQEAVPENLAVKTTRIGAASIGNWSLPTKPDSEFAIRNLNGSIDEFAIFAAALTADEIQEIYKHGKP